MATATNIAARILLDTGAFSTGVAVVAQGTARIAASVTGANKAMEASNVAVDSSTSAWERANNSAGGYLKTVLGIAGAGAMVASSVKAASGAEQDQLKSIAAQHRNDLGGMGGDATPVVTLANSYEKLSRAVTRAYETFGAAFARSANLTRTMEILRSAVNNLTTFLGTLGSAIGSVVGWFLNTPPVFLAVAVALKVVVAAAIVLAHVLITRLIVAMATWLIFGAAMSPTALAIAAAKLAWAAATTIVAGTIWLLNAAMAVLIAIGFPIWTALAVVALALAAAVAVVANVSWGLVAAWQALTEIDSGADRLARMLEFASATKDAREKVEDLEAELEKSVRQHGWTDEQKELEKYVQSLQKWQDDAASQGMDIHDDLQKRLADYQALQKVYADLEEKEKKQKELKKQQKDLAAELKKIAGDNFAAGGSDIDKKVSALQQLGAKPSQLAWARQALEMTEDANKIAENRKEIEKQIADIQRDAATIGLSEAEKRVAMLKELGATQEQLAKADSAAKALDQAKREKEIQDLAKSIDKSQPFKAFQQRIQDIQKLLAAGKINPVDALAVADAAQKTLIGSFDASSTKYESPNALLKGSAEADLAENRAKNPLEQLTDIQRQNLAEAKQINTALKDEIALIKAQNQRKQANF